LCRLPRRVIDKISVLGLPYLLEGTRYNLAKVTQLLGLVRSEDWTGYEQVGALPIQLVGTSFTRLAMDIPLPVLYQVAGGEVTVTKEDEVEDVLASGGPPEQTLPPGRSPREKEYPRPYLVGPVARSWKSVPFSAVRSLQFHRVPLEDIT
jgi:hypothetical protein